MSLLVKSLSTACPSSHDLTGNIGGLSSGSAPVDIFLAYDILVLRS